MAIVPQLSAWVHGQKMRPLWVAPAIWIALSGAVFAIAPSVRSLNIPFPAEAVAGAAIIFGVFLLVPLRHRGRSRFGRVIWCRMGAGLMAAYILFATGMHTIALGQLRQYAEEGHINY